MAIKAKFYTFRKPHNSTAIPLPEELPYYEMDLTIIEPSSIVNPTIVVELGTGASTGVLSSPVGVNYCYIKDWGRYYWVNDWIADGRRWRAKLNVDVLGSFRESIGAQTCYITRSSVEKNGEIADGAYPVTTKVTCASIQGTNPFNTEDGLSGGCYIVGIVGKITKYYIFPVGIFEAFLDYLFSDAYAAALVGPEWLTLYPQLKAQANPLQYITSCKWFPFMPTGIPVDHVPVGWVDVPINALEIGKTGIANGEQSWGLGPLWHPQSSGRGSYLNTAPYTYYSLYYPPWGKIELDPTVVYHGKQVRTVANFDLRTGTGILTVWVKYGDDPIVLSTLQAQVGVDIQLSNIRAPGYGIGNMLAPAAQIAGSVATGFAPGAVIGVSGAILDMANSRLPSVSTIGGAGGVASLRGTPALMAEHHWIVEGDNAHKGSPLCELRKISDLGGYMVIDHPEFDLTCTDSEADMIADYMRGGFYYR